MREEEGHRHHRKLMLQQTVAKEGSCLLRVLKLKWSGEMGDGRALA